MVRAGTSGFAYKEWKGSFYPEDVPDREMLAYYAGRFGAVEINNTFYRMPTAKGLAQWAAQVPEGFRFILKANQQITHYKRLKDEAVEPTQYFWSQATTLGDRLGPILFQLPPNLKADVARLEAFLDRLPAGCSPAFEFRHASWHDDAVFDALRARQAALVIAQTEEAETPLVATAPWGYLRLRKEVYAPGELEDWARKVADQDWTDTFVFFKHEDEGAGPKLARQFMDLVEGSPRARR